MRDEAGREGQQFRRPWLGWDVGRDRGDSVWLEQSLSETSLHNGEEQRYGVQDRARPTVPLQSSFPREVLTESVTHSSLELNGQIPQETSSVFHRE